MNGNELFIIDPGKPLFDRMKSFGTTLDHLMSDDEVVLIAKILPCDQLIMWQYHNDPDLRKNQVKLTDGMHQDRLTAQ